MIYKLAIRNLLKNKKISLYKLCGLVIAFLTLLVISVWVFNDLSYDRFHSKANRIYRLSVEQVEKERNFSWYFARTWQRWRRDIPDYFPEIEEMAELVPLFSTTVKTGEHKFTTRKAFASDSSLFKVFDIGFTEGDPVHAIDNKNTIVISQEIANRYFPGQSAMNKTMEIEYFDEFVEHTITGVFKNLPQNSHFQLDLIVNYHRPEHSSGNEWAYTYYLLKEGCDIHDIESGIPGFMDNHVPENQRNSSTLHFMPLTDIHLKSHIEREIQVNGDIRQVRLFILIAAGILLMALINYINLNTVDYGRRIMIFNVNKFLGAKSRHNIASLIIESLLITTMALLISLVLYNPFKILLNSLGIEYALNLQNGFMLQLALILLSTHLFITLSGILPVFIVNLRHSSILTRQHQSSPLLKTKYQVLNNTMLIIQFSISIIVIICGLILRSQNNYLLDNQLGGRDNTIISISRAFAGNDNEPIIFCNEIRKLPEIIDFTSLFDAPTYYIKDMRLVDCPNIPEHKRGQLITICPTDERFFNFFNIRLITGRYMEPYQEDQKHINYIINEKAVKQMGFASAEEAIGSDFRLSSINNDIPFGGKIVGVVEDFYYSSLYHPIEATAYYHMPRYYGTTLVKTTPGTEKVALQKIKSTWNRLFPDYPMDYQFLNDIYYDTYRKDLIQGKLFNLFAIISIIISSLGLIGISNIILLQKIKEIGIRKVNGAKLQEILVMLNSGYIKWILIASIVACPVAWYIMNAWLENFAYRISIGGWSIALSVVFVLFIAILTVSLQSWRTAKRNPVEALRYE